MPNQKAPMPNTSKFDIDGEAIRELAALMEETGLTEIEVSQGERHIRVAKTQPVVQAAPAYSGLAHHSAPHTPDIKPTETPITHPGTVNSPMVGTAYLRPDPASAPFVKVGDTVSAGDTLLIIEAMKVMNPIKASKGGTVSRIIVSDAQPVEFGEALLIVE